MITVKATIVPKKIVPKPPKPKRIWDNYQVMGEVIKSDRIKFVVAAAIRDGVRYINIREFYLKKSEQVWKPGRDGITIPLLVPIENGMKLIEPYFGLVDLITETMRHVKTMDLHDEANAIYYVKGDK
jgi:hypothetical protein